jgi:endonuclease-3
MPDGAARDAQTDLNSKALLVHQRLCAAYRCPVAYFHDLYPLSELVSSLLSHRTKNADSGRAFKELRRRLPTWEQVRDAPTADVQDAIAASTWPEQKAPRIQQVLRLIGERCGGELSLDFLKDLPPAEAIAWLRALPGVGPKTAAAVLSFSSLRMAALPVDCHHHRVAQRLALIGPKVDVASAHALLAAQLPSDFDAQQVYDNHEVMMLHGQRCCYHTGPACHRCPVLDLCPFGQARTKRANDPAQGRGPVDLTTHPRTHPDSAVIDGAKHPKHSRRSDSPNASSRAADDLPF